MAHKLLLADDSQTIQRVVDLVLQPEGFDVKAFGNGEDAFKAIGALKPEIILADVDMPKLNGYELCRRVRSDSSTAGIPVILLAGAFEPFDEEYARSVGIDDIIVKPFESHELISKVKALLLRATLAHMEEPPAAPFAASVVAAEPASVAEWAEPQPITLGAPDAVPEPATTAAPAASFIDSLRLELAELRKEVSPAVDIEMPPPSDELRERDLTPLPESQSVSAALAALQEFKESFQTEPESAVPVHETADRECVSKETVEHFLHDQGGRMVEDIVRDSVNYLTGSLKDEIAASVQAGVRLMVERELTLILKEAVRLAVSETVPRVVEQTVRDAVQEVMASLGSDINAEIRKVIPEIAEAIITKEIERISAGLS